MVLQNDIGTTDAHVIVVHVEGLRAQLHHTDVYRLLFFRSLFGLARRLEDTCSHRIHSMEDGAYHLMCVSTYTARKAKELRTTL
ncbi:MAG: hypothetical protein M5R42_06615 [Rhodocyclaceae bacterium]|nr:hypothetical protein [Rhodocyclaceae bacterium]